MRLPMLLLLLLAAAAPTALAKAAPPMTHKSFCEALEGAEWSTRFGSCKGKDLEDADVSAARAAFTQDKQQCIDLLNAGTSQKRLKFDKTGAQKCVDAWRAYVKDPQRAKEKHDAARLACATVVEGLRAAGESCDSSLDCKTGLTCRGAQGKGKCVEPLAKGTECDDEALSGSNLFSLAAAKRPLCAPGLHCGPGDGGAQACIPDFGEGKACKGESPRECGPGLRCVKGSCKAETRSKAGGACGTHADCDLTTYCAAGKCQPKKPQGSYCGATDECLGACRKGHCAARCGG